MVLIVISLVVAFDSRVKTHALYVGLQSNCSLVSLVHNRTHDLQLAIDLTLRALQKLNRSTVNRQKIALTDNRGGARVFAARGKRLCCRPRQSDRQSIFLWLQR